MLHVRRLAMPDAERLSALALLKQDFADALASGALQLRSKADPGITGSFEVRREDGTPDIGFGWPDSALTKSGAIALDIMRMLSRCKVWDA